MNFIAAGEVHVYRSLWLHDMVEHRHQMIFDEDNEIIFTDK